MGKKSILTTPVSRRGAITGNMDNKGISLGKFSDKVPADVQSKIAEYADQIKSGSFLTDDEVSAIESTL